jgi:hypothetical protein
MGKMERYVFIVLILLVILMVKNPKKTTAQITTGEGAAAGVGSAVMAGFFTAPKKG